MFTYFDVPLGRFFFFFWLFWFWLCLPLLMVMLMVLMFFLCYFNRSFTVAYFIGRICIYLYTIWLLTFFRTWTTEFFVTRLAVACTSLWLHQKPSLERQNLKEKPDQRQIVVVEMPKMFHVSRNAGWYVWWFIFKHS